jgi:hypothetical protein
LVEKEAEIKKVEKKWQKEMSENGFSENGYREVRSEINGANAKFENGRLVV